MRLLNACQPEGPREPLPGSTRSWFAYGLAAPYSPNRVRPPFYVDLLIACPTDELIPAVWERWLPYAPFRAIYPFAENLRQYRGIYLDVGFRDEHDLHLGHRLPDQWMTKLGIAHDHHEHDGAHSSHAMERLLLAAKITARCMRTRRRRPLVHGRSPVA